MPAPPVFSIIIPTYNRPERLWECLEALTRLAYPSNSFEVIVVDDGSPQSLEKVIDPFSAQLNIRLFRQENAGPATARNNGARHARGAYLAFIDDDCQPAPGWLNQMAQQLKRTPDRLLGGKTINCLKHNRFSAASQFIVDIVYQHFNPNPDEARFFASNNMVVPTKIFNEIGRFSNGWRTSEDRELCDRWLWSGYKMCFVEGAVISHSHDLTFFSYCKQHFSYGKGAFHFHRIRNNRQSGTFAQEMKFHTNLKNWLLAPFTKKEKSSVTLFFLLIVWQVANLMGFLWAACSEGPIAQKGYLTKL